MEPSINCLLRISLITVGRIALLILMELGEAGSIGCFVCSSFNGTNPACEDAFNSTINTNLKPPSGTHNYQHPCWAFKKERQGLFPADHCIKVNGYRSDMPSQTMVIRTCAIDSGTLTADTEIVRISHCGHYKYEGHQYTGCVQACDTDGCNAAAAQRITPACCILLLIILFRTISLNTCRSSPILPVFNSSSYAHSLRLKRLTSVL